MRRLWHPTPLPAPSTTARGRFLAAHAMPARRGRFPSHNRSCSHDPMHRLTPLVLLAVGLAWASPSASLAQSAGAPQPPVSASSYPDGTVTLSGGSIAAGIGLVWGDGELVFRGQQHGFGVHGLSVLDVGAAGFTATGAVYNLHRLGDFAGNYVAVTTGITVAGGSVVYLRDQNGVVVQLDSTTQGLRLNLSGEGAGVALTS